ncbi:hypothetical protein COT48_00365 [Candidatus Woesearchaeota archaeon CG08_land_8_20_14_0_20_47_9]|nr:MAG: hypothetical protein COT48_00365 [Candidatus Woesearchaeota archaeon CG08_land_8_20_14_0_20_47_9]
MKISLLLISFFLLALAPAKARADASVAVSPARIDAEVNAGSHKEFALRVFNLHDEATEYSCWLSDSPPWIHTSEKSMVIKESGYSDLILRIAPPKKTPDGEYRTTLYVKPELEATVTPAVGVRIRVRVTGGLSSAAQDSAYDSRRDSEEGNADINLESSQQAARGVQEAGRETLFAAGAGSGDALMAGVIAAPDSNAVDGASSDASKEVVVWEKAEGQNAGMQNRGSLFSSPLERMLLLSLGVLLTLVMAALIAAKGRREAA